MKQIISINETPPTEPDQGEALPATIRPVAAPSTEASEVVTVHRPDTAGATLFDAYVMVDWSSSRVPVYGAIRSGSPGALGKVAT